MNVTVLVGLWSLIKYHLWGPDSRVVSSSETPFDMLPVILSDESQVPKFYDIPSELLLIVPITHPKIKAIGESYMNVLSARRHL